MISLLEAIAIVTYAGLVFSLVALCPLWAPDTVYRRQSPLTNAEGTKGPLITITDLMLLTFQLGVVNSLVALVQLPPPNERPILLQVAANTFVLLNWYRCLVFMQRRCISRQWPRVCAQLFLYPAAVVVVGQIFGCVMICLVGLGEGRVHILPLVAFVLISLWIFMIYLLRAIYRKVVPHGL